VRDVLRDWLAGPQYPYAVEALRTRWWRSLWPGACDPSDELDKQLMSLAYEHLEGEQRDQLVREVQEWAFARMVGDAHPSTVSWDVLFGARIPEMAEAVTFFAALADSGRTPSTEVGSKLCAVLEREPRDTALAFLGNCSELLANLIYEALKGRLPRHPGTATPDECRAVAFTFVLATRTPAGSATEQQRVLLERLAGLVAAMPKDVRAAVDRSCPGGLGRPWRDWVSGIEPRRLRLRSRSSTGPGKQPGCGGE
jgi:hypothetical protein